MKTDVTALGELLIDFTQNGISEQGNPLFECNPGGAPCNVLAMLRKLGHSASFIGKVGADMFGEMLTGVLDEIGISTSYLTMDDTVNTTLAFVKTAPDGDRSFSFFRKPGADRMLNREETPAQLLENTRIFHFGTLSMTHEPAREATKFAVETAKKAGAIISFDPNLRPPLWDNLTLAKEQIEYGLGKCDVLKISDNELTFMTGEEDLDKAVAAIRQKYDIALLLATAGKDGATAYYKTIKATAPAFSSLKTIDTTGAGDTFCGCCLHGVLEYGLETLNEEKLTQMLRFANAAAGLVTTKKGAIRSMPDKEQIETLLK